MRFVDLGSRVKQNRYGVVSKGLILSFQRFLLIYFVILKLVLWFGLDGACCISTWWDWNACGWFRCEYIFYKKLSEQKILFLWRIVPLWICSGSRWPSSKPFGAWWCTCMHQWSCKSFRLYVIIQAYQLLMWNLQFLVLCFPWNRICLFSGEMVKKCTLFVCVFSLLLQLFCFLVFLRWWSYYYSWLLYLVYML